MNLGKLDVHLECIKYFSIMFLVTTATVVVLTVLPWWVLVFIASILFYCFVYIMIDGVSYK